MNSGIYRTPKTSQNAQMSIELHGNSGKMLITYKETKANTNRSPNPKKLHNQTDQTNLRETKKNLRKSKKNNA